MLTGIRNRNWETLVFWAATGVALVHALDDAFFNRQPGVPPGQHALAALVTQTLSDQGIVFAVPYLTLAVFVAVAIGAGMLAAILPARRASRLNVLEALQYE